MCPNSEMEESIRNSGGVEGGVCVCVGGGGGLREMVKLKFHVSSCN